MGAKQQELSTPKAKAPPKSPKTWKSDAHITADYGLKDRSSNKKTKRSGSDAEAKDTFMGGDRARTNKKRKRKVADHDSMRYDEGKAFKIKGMSALNLLLDEAA